MSEYFDAADIAIAVEEKEREMTIKYVVCPGTVISKTDGQRHYIKAPQLMKLYGVRPEECVVHIPQDWWRLIDLYRAIKSHEGLIRLGPRYDGDYTLPKEV